MWPRKILKPIPSNLRTDKIAYDSVPESHIAIEVLPFYSDVLSQAKHEGGKNLSIRIRCNL